MLCPLSGIAPDGGPTCLIDMEDLDTVSTTMASEILSYDQVSPQLTLQDLASILSSALKLASRPLECWTVNDLASKLPVGISDWDYFNPVGIGHFDASEGGVRPIDEHGRCPSGRSVEVRRLGEYSGDGRFDTVLIVDYDDDEAWVRQRTEWRYSLCSVANCNLFIMGGCLEYLRAWLDPSGSLPPRVAFMENAPSMSLEGELYEIVNSRYELRDDSGLFTSFRYGDIPKTLQGDQIRFLRARKGSHHTSRGIAAGLRGKDLLPALFADFQCWLTMRPDVWPSPTSESTPAFTFMQLVTSPLDDSNPFSALPTELLLDIFRHLPIRALFSLSSASRSLRSLITEPAFLNQVIKAAVLTGAEFWVLPVASIPGEEERARVVAMEWLSAVSPDHDVPITEPPFHSASFPYLAFVRACYASDSMRNRQRLWDIVKQFEELWRDYRLYGWERDVFIT
ncbi:hypothetical protein GALMADRAFT_253776 [Galerina marginata CBS 339.88]|uniref:F-box domain-containing protein n=1 Tax=Galerina marginata (strain CBS 339.88) TaxID=685588 RepID=A0A067SKS5_GALM3|nr:hypothetical protein GALMADRAFT_253776 [Galerina marginata CBS 339.88]